MDGIEDENDVLDGVLKGNIDFNKTVGKKRIKDSTWKELIDHFNNPEFILINENFEFPDLLGAAYEYLIKFFADSSGKKGGEFYTPSEVVRLLVQLIKPEEKNSVYDPTVGSGGMLIQSSQYVEEQGGDSRKVALYGQEKAGTVWSICMMNMILHNRPDAHIEHGDTIEEPLIREGGTIKKFDRVIANPPFSQNYTRANVTFESRFKYGWAPESGKKADLMFVQHMIASLKSKGRMATIMPHGVLFRGGQDKIIREELVSENGGTVIEAIIGLPPKLFYGTSIPACVLVINKNKPDELRDKIFFINADAEYGEGKNQNKLRPEDIEKIDYVFTNKIQIPKYSRLVDIKTIVENDFNLNIRRYVDNTLEPEPEDVKAHLIGGIPKREVEDKKDILEKFNFKPSNLFKEKNSYYFIFKPLESKDEIKRMIESNQNVKDVYVQMQDRVREWWKTAKVDFSKIAKSKENGVRIAEIRTGLLNSLKKDLTKIGVLDEFQSAGIFVNWWKNTKYDLKTITSTGWSPALIPDELMIATFFKNEIEEIEELESKISETENHLSEEFDETDFEPEEGKKITANKVKNYLLDEANSVLLNHISWEKSKNPSRSQIKKILQETEIKTSALKEINKILELHDKISSLNSKKNSLNKKLKKEKKELEFKIELKREGGEESKTKYKDLIEKAEQDIEKYEGYKEKEKIRKKKIKNLKKDIKTLKEKLDKIDELIESIGGKISEEQSKELILEKQFNMINDELYRYLNQEKRCLIGVFENLWAKYASSAEDLENNREKTMSDLNNYLRELNYYG